MQRQSDLFKDTLDFYKDTDQEPVQSQPTEKRTSKQYKQLIKAKCISFTFKQQEQLEFVLLHINHDHYPVLYDRIEKNPETAPELVSNEFEALQVVDSYTGLTDDEKLEYPRRGSVFSDKSKRHSLQVNSRRNSYRLSLLSNDSDDAKYQQKERKTAIPERQSSLQKKERNGNRKSKGSDSFKPSRKRISNDSRVSDKPLEPQQSLDTILSSDDDDTYAYKRKYRDSATSIGATVMIPNQNSSDLSSVSSAGGKSSSTSSASLLEDSDSDSEITSAIREKLKPQKFLSNSKSIEGFIPPSSNHSFSSSSQSRVSDRKDGWLVCGVCYNDYPTRALWEDHSCYYASTHCSQDITCPTCDEYLDSEADLKTHTCHFSDHEEYPYCYHCGLEFYTNEDLQHHDCEDQLSEFVFAWNCGPAISKCCFGGKPKCHPFDSEAKTPGQHIRFNDDSDVEQVLEGLTDATHDAVSRNIKSKVDEIEQLMNGLGLEK
ncbi:hypothetical protein HDV01_004573 [Terramyces sp. JEL0728]|nr:hypothetical protein HDV01_004573 [Terramyces sp. JEL0728]